MSKNFLNYINSFLTVLWCSSVSTVCLIVASFFWLRRRAPVLLFRGVGVVTSGLRSELLDGVVWYGFSFVLHVFFYYCKYHLICIARKSPFPRTKTASELCYRDAHAQLWVCPHCVGPNISTAWVMMNVECRYHDVSNRFRFCLKHYLQNRRTVLVLRCLQF